MTDQLTKRQIERFARLPEDIRTMMLQLGEFEKHVRLKPTLAPPDVVASPIAIILAICRAHNITARDLKSPSRKRVAVYPRYYGYHLLRSNGMTAKRIGEIFRKDHSSVLYGCDIHEEMMQTQDPVYVKGYIKVLEAIKGQLASQINGSRIYRAETFNRMEAVPA